MMFLPFALALASFAPAPKPAMQLVYTLERVSIQMGGERPSFKRETEKKEIRPGTSDQRSTTISEDGTSIFELSGKTFIYEKISPSGVRERREMSVEQWGQAVMGGFEEHLGVKIEEFGKNGSSAYLNEYRTIAGHKCIKNHSRTKIGEYEIEQIAWEPVDKKLRGIIPALEKYIYTVNGETRTLSTAETIINFKLAKKL